jgi:hypothetical protein
MNDSNHAANHDTVNYDTVTRVLACLRDVEAPAGLDQRILAAMHQRVEANTIPSRSSILTTPLFWLAATATAIVAVTLWWSTSSRQTHNLATHTQTTTIPSSTQKAGAPFIAQNNMSEIPCQSAKGGCPIHDAKRHGWGHSSEAQTAVEASTTTPQATPLPDTLAASHPAPPLPLTEQEQLLLRIVHKGDPIELASLSNDFRNSQPIRDAEDFQRFFKPPASPHPTETQPTTGDQPAQQNQPDLEGQPNTEAQPAPEPSPNDIPQQ